MKNAVIIGFTLVAFSQFANALDVQFERTSIQAEPVQKMNTAAGPYNFYEGISFTEEQSKKIMAIHQKAAERFHKEQALQQQEIAKIMTPEQRLVYEKNKKEATLR